MMRKINHGPAAPGAKRGEWTRMNTDSERHELHGFSRIFPPNSCQFVQFVSTLPLPFSTVQRRRSYGFSLLEMMVAVTLMLIIIAALLAVFYQTQRAFRLSVTQVDVLETGRTQMEAFGSELPEIVPSYQNGQVNLYAATMFPFLIQPRSGIPNAAPRTNVIQDIYFLRQHNDDWIGTGYFVVSPLVPPSTEAIGTLYRFELVVTNASYVYTLFRSFQLAIASFPTNSHRVMDRVVNLKLTPYDNNGLVMTNLIDSRDYSFTSSFTNAVVPAYLDLELGILEPRAYEKYKALAEIKVNPADPRAFQYLSNHVEKVHLFRQRIPIHTGQ
jgi:prepilin-type N-terminal cleavage/methylation domain-containing protein